MCDDVAKFIEEMKAHDIDCEPVKEEDWGLLTHVARRTEARRLPAAPPASASHDYAVGTNRQETRREENGKVGQAGEKALMPRLANGAITHHESRAAPAPRRPSPCRNPVQPRRG